MCHLCRRGWNSGAFLTKHAQITIVGWVRCVSHHIFCEYYMDVALNFCIVIQMFTKDWYVEFEDGREVSCWERCDIRHMLHCGALWAWRRAPISDLAICRAHDLIHHEFTDVVWENLRGRLVELIQKTIVGPLSLLEGLNRNWVILNDHFLVYLVKYLALKREDRLIARYANGLINDKGTPLT